MTLSPDDREVLVDERLSVSQWASVLNLSASWCMGRVTAIALREMYEIGTSNCKEWEAVLEVSNKHKPVLLDAWILAIQKISTIIRPSALEGIRLGRQYRVTSFFQDGLQKLVQRNQYFTDEEEDGLGRRTTSKLYRIREEYHRCRDCGNCRNKRTRGDKKESAINAIKKAFKDELDEMTRYNV